MKYDFDEIIPRRGTNSVKWDEAAQENVIPLWVADMDFGLFLLLSRLCIVGLTTECLAMPMYQKATMSRLSAGSVTVMA